MPQLLSEHFQSIVKQVESDSNAIGLFLSGSRGKGLQKEHSDYDFVIILLDEVSLDVKAKYEKIDKIDGFDCGVNTLTELKEYAELGTECEWDRYSFAHVKVTVDKTDGELQRIIDEKGKIPKKHLQKYISGYLDGYINAVYRSMKCLRDNYNFGFRLEAASSISLFLTCAFAVHDRRLSPYPKYIQFELEKFPLTKFPWTAKVLMDKIQKILETGDYKLQQELLTEMEKIMRKEGFDAVFDSWEGQDKWTMTFKP